MIEWLPVAAYLVVHVAPPLTSRCEVQPELAFPPSRNSTEPDGWIGPLRAAAGAMLAV
jgi:hypothetical protein